MLRMLLASFRRFGTTYCSNFKGQTVLDRLSNNVGKKVPFCAA